MKKLTRNDIIVLFFTIFFRRRFARIKTLNVLRSKARTQFFIVERNRFTN